MKRRVMIGGVAAVASLLVPLAAATPAANAGTGVGCVGSKCSASVWQFVKLTGSVGQGGSGDTVQINVPPPPCLWVKFGDAVNGSKQIIATENGVDPGAPYDLFNTVKQAKQLVKNPQPGEWYVLPVNPAAGPAGAAACNKLPLYYFVPPGGAPPMPHVPAIDLAEFAYNNMLIPHPVVTTTPSGKSFVNLGTYVHLGMPAQVSVTATLGKETVTVTARPKPRLTQISASSAGRAFSNCVLTGSRHSTAPRTGAGVPPDCGVLWQAPTPDGAVTATVTWRVTFTPGGPQTLPNVVLTGNSKPLRVAEIQSINGNS